MTEERSHTDSVEDTLVSQTYREAAVEQVPDELDQAVLQRARQHSSDRYSRSVIWLRPMAWAATIGLCLAIVVEISNVPQPTAEQLARPTAADLMTTGGKLDEKTVPVKRITGGTATTDTNKAIAPQRAETEVLRQRARKTIDDQGRVSLQDVPQHSKTEARESEFVPAETRESLESKDNGALLAPMLEEADRVSGLRTITITASPAAAAEPQATCDVKVRATPQTWLECIEALEEDGLDDVARKQREQLQAVFPNFDMP